MKTTYKETRRRTVNFESLGRGDVFTYSGWTPECGQSPCVFIKISDSMSLNLASLSQTMTSASEKVWPLKITAMEVTLK